MRKVPEMSEDSILASRRVVLNEVNNSDQFLISRRCALGRYFDGGAAVRPGLSHPLDYLQYAWDSFARQHSDQESDQAN